MLRETDLFEIEERGELQIKVGTFKICSGFIGLIVKYDIRKTQNFSKAKLNILQLDIEHAFLYCYLSSYIESSHA
jgi:hypothetical protein